MLQFLSVLLHSLIIYFHSNHVKRRIGIRDDINTLKFSIYNP